MLHNIRRFSALGLIALLPIMAHAQAAVIFERVQARIDRVAPMADAAQPLPAPLQLDVELRPEDSLRLEYIHTLNTLTATTGIMIGLDSPAIVPVPAMKVYTPVDIVFIAEDGMIMQIAPGVVMGEMTQPIQAKAPIKAMLFLKAGTAAARGLQPHKYVVSAKIFTPAPNVQE